MKTCRDISGLGKYKARIKVSWMTFRYVKYKCKVVYIYSPTLS